MAEYHGERLARVEVEIQAMKESFEEHKRETNEKLERMTEKLDDLLALRNKGAGVFWLIASLIGTGIVGGAIQFFHYWFPTK